jgi:predicted esterase
MGDRREQIWAISPHHTARPSMPPIIHFHGDADCTVQPYIVRHFADKMAELGNDYELIFYEGRGHYLGPSDKRYATYFDDEILERTDRFLAEKGFRPPER